MISRLLLPSAVRLATYSLVRRSRRIRATQIMYSARLASLLEPRLRRWLTTLPEEASTGETPHTDWRRTPRSPICGVVPSHHQERRGVVGADARQGDQLRGHLRHQPAEVRLQLGDLCRECLVAAGHRTERELGGRGHVTRVTCEAEACGHTEELLAPEPTQSLAQLLRCRDAQKLCSWLAACVLAFIAE